MKRVTLLLSLLVISVCVLTSCKREKTQENRPVKTATTKQQQPDTTKSDSAETQVSVTPEANLASDTATLFSLLRDAKAGDTIWIDTMLTLKSALLIDKKDNLTIIGKKPGVGFQIPSIEEDVIAIKNSSHITITNIHASHSVKTRCEAPVIGIYRSGDITIEGCDLNGSGETGVTADDCTGEITLLHNEIHNCSREGVEIYNSSVTCIKNNFYNNGKGVHNSQGIKTATPHIRLHGQTAALKTEENQFDRTTKLIKNDKGYYRKPIDYFHSTKTCEVAVEKCDNIWRDQEYSYSNFKRTRGKGFVSEGMEFDIPITLRLPVKKGGKTYHGKLYYTHAIFNRNDPYSTTSPVFIDSARYGDSYCTLELRLYRVGIVTDCMATPAAAYLLEVDYGTKGGEGHTTFLNVLKEGATLYIDCAGLDKNLRSLILPPYTYIENAGGNAEVWENLENFDLFSGVQRVELCNLSMFPKKLGKSVKINDKILILQREYHAVHSFKSEAEIHVAGFPLLVKKEFPHYNDSAAAFFYKGKHRESKDVQGYHIEYPDGTVALYGLAPIPSATLRLQTSKKIHRGDEIYFTDRSHLNAYSGDQSRNWSGLGPTVTFINDSLLPDSLLEAVGTIGKSTYSRDTLFRVRKPKHWLHRKLYTKLKEDRRSYFPNKEDEPLYHPKQFLNTLPYFFRRDPFGNLVSYMAHSYIPQMMTEPIIYLYSDNDTTVEILLDSSVQVSAAIPSFTEQTEGSLWSIKVENSGVLTDLGTGRKHDRLFWEGQSKIFPPIDTGFLVTVDKLEPLLDSLLDHQGLNAKERRDFIEAWTPEMSLKKWVAFRFYDQALIEKTAPLKVTPTPETTIRVMMGYRPLDKGVAYIPKQQVPKGPPRKSFTLVEWGGVSL